MASVSVFFHEDGSVELFTCEVPHLRIDVQDETADILRGLWNFAGDDVERLLTAIAEEKLEEFKRKIRPKLDRIMHDLDEAHYHLKKPRAPYSDESGS